MKVMKALNELSAAEARAVRAVYTDIDDTLTTDGLLPAEAFEAMWSLHRAGLAVVPVTGRPAGWCDHFARMWPVAGVVGENGAFYFRYDHRARRMIKRFVLDEAERARLQERLGVVRARVLREVPGAGIASDQPYRIHDLAIDYCEDVAPLDRDAVARVVEIFREEGAVAKVSSIHVNGWFGDYDKLGMIRVFAREVLGLELDRPEQRALAVYAGDSPNDEPAFAFFELGVGVANIRRFAAQLAHPPSYVTEREGGEGFAELARYLLNARRG